MGCYIATAAQPFFACLVKCFCSLTKDIPYKTHFKPRVEIPLRKRKISCEVSNYSAGSPHLLSVNLNLLSDFEHFPIVQKTCTFHVFLAVLSRELVLPDHFSPSLFWASIQPDCFVSCVYEQIQTIRAGSRLPRIEI